MSGVGDKPDPAATVSLRFTRRPFGLQAFIVRANALLLALILADVLHRLWALEQLQRFVDFLVVQLPIANIRRTATAAAMADQPPSPQTSAGPGAAAGGGRSDRYFFRFPTFCAP
jgi:hypothetical protein